MVFPEY